MLSVGLSTDSSNCIFLLYSNIYATCSSVIRSLFSGKTGVCKGERGIFEQRVFIECSRIEQQSDELS